MVMRYRFSDIFNFIEAASCSTISQAAIKLEISQPALSESIMRLESDVGHTLFYRSRSGIQLTPAGKLFLKKANSVAAALEDLNLDSDDEHVFGGRVVSIGCHPTVAQYCLPLAFTSLKRLAPDFKVQLIHDLSRNIQVEVQRGNIDVGIVINPVEVPDLVIQKLAMDNVYVWTKDSTKFFDTVICNQSLFQTQSILKKWVKKPKKIIETENLELIVRLTNEGIGYGIVPERAVDLLDLNLIKLPQLPSYKDKICLVYRPEFGKTLPEKMIIDSIKQVFLNN